MKCLHLEDLVNILGVKMADGSDGQNGILQSVDVTQIILSCLLVHKNVNDVRESWMRVRRVCKMWRDIGELDNIQTSH